MLRATSNAPQLHACVRKHLQHVFTGMLVHMLFWEEILTTVVNATTPPLFPLAVGGGGQVSRPMAHLPTECTSPNKKVPCSSRCHMHVAGCPGGAQDAVLRLPVPHHSDWQHPCDSPAGKQELTGCSDLPSDQHPRYVLRFTTPKETRCGATQNPTTSLRYMSCSSETSHALCTICVT